MSVNVYMCSKRGSACQQMCTCAGREAVYVSKCIHVQQERQCMSVNVYMCRKRGSVCQ